MSKVQDAVIAIAAQRLALIEGEKKGEPLVHAGIARLVTAMFLACQGAGACETCLLGGIRICPYEHCDDPGASELLSKPAA